MPKCLQTALLMGGLCLLYSVASAQTIVVKKCVSPSPAFSTSSTGPAGVVVGGASITMSPGVDYPVGYVITDMYVEVTWSKTAGSCSFPTAGAVDLSEVGFGLVSPLGTSRYFAASASNAAVLGAASSTWVGTNQVLNMVSAFHNGSPSILPAAAPVADTFNTNGHSLTSLLPAGASADYLGDNPSGNWNLLAVDAPSANPAVLCVHSYCVTFVLCDFNSLDADCKATANLSLGASGTATPNYQTLNNNSDTSCLLSSMVFMPAATYTCADVGSTIPITMTLTDRLGHTDACVTNVTIVDDTPPTMNCHNYDVYLNAAGSFTFVAADSIVASDNCGLAPGGLRINNLPSVTYTCANAGTAPTVTLSASDVYGNIASCPVQIFIYDTVPPNAVCQDRTVYVNTSGSVIVNASQIDGGSTESCPPIFNRLINGAASQTYTCADLGPNPATLDVYDVWSNVDFCTATVTVLDTIRPTATCATLNANLNILGTVTVAAGALNNGSIDNCTISSFNVGGAPNISFNCSHVGTPQTVPLTVVDNSGNQNTCNATVNVLDVTPPTASCQNISTYLNTSGNVTVNAAQLNGGSTDVCSGTTLTYLVNGGASVSYTCTALGSAQPVTLTATDQSGNSSTCAATVTVLDTVSPDAICQPITAYLNAAGTVSVTGTQINNNSTDNCTITTYLINNAASVSYNCSHIAAVQTATLRVQDVSNNFDVCNASITVRDTIDPTATCNNITVSLGASGTATVNVASVVTPADACGVSSSTINGGATAIYNCSQLGNNTATVVVTDANGNTSTCNATVTVQDNIAPVAVCQNINAYLAPTSVAVTATQINNGSSDNCGSITTQINGGASVNYTCANLGPNNATLTVRDASNNTTTCPATITVLDTVRPTALCLGSISASLDATGTVTVLPSQINNSSIDNCSSISYLINGAASVTYNCSHVTTSPNIATLTVTDASGNSRTCTTQVTVQDGVAPVANCVNGTFYVDLSGQVVVDATDIGSTSTDNCPPPSLTINGFVNPSQTYNCSQLGANAVTIIAQDASGGTAVCNATVTVLDTIDPTANCNAAMNAYIGAAGNVTVTATQVNNLSADNCGVVSTNLSGSASKTYTCANIGTNAETLNVLDASGNSASCPTVITVADTTRPTAICQNRTVSLGIAGTGSVTAAQISNGSVDNCGTVNLFLNTIGNTQVNYNCTNIGTSTVTLIVRDASGNQRTCTATVTVADNSAPNTVCQSGVSVYLAPTTVVVTPAQIDGGSVDNCGTASSSVSPNSFNCAQVGNQNVTLTVTDVNGNVGTCSTTILVRDTIKPTMGCQPQTITLDAAGSATVAATAINLGSVDNCSIASFQISNGGTFASNLTFNCANIGANAVTLQATDVNGNVNTCNTTVTVQDLTLPVASCRNITANIGAGGTVTVLGTDLNSTTTPSSDNCSPLSFFINNVGNTDTVFSCAQVGPRNLTLIVRDPSGNQSTCISTVTVADVTPPTATCQTGVSIYLNTSGTANVTTTQIDNNSIDNCSIASMSVSPTSFACAQVGTQNVTLTVTDVNANTATCVASVTVRDTIKPTMVCNNFTLSLHPVSGTATLLPTDIGNGSTDACGISTRLIREGASGAFASSLLYNCAQLGAHTVTFQATDANGNVNTCNSTVTVQDVTNPTALCKNIVANIGATGDVTVLASQLNNNSTDNCSGGLTYSINTVGNTDTVFTCADVGNRNLTLIVRDAAGNQSTCTSTVTVVDNSLPTANCQSATAYLDIAGVVTVTGAMVNNGSVDNCNTLTMTVAPSTFNCNNVGGVNNVVLTVTDASGNSSSCNALVDVQDTMGPAMTCKPDTAYVGVSGFVSESATEIDGGTIDNCGIASLLIRRADAVSFSANALYTCADVGLQQVTLQAIDIYGNVDSCHTTVLVRDTVKPIMSCITPITLDLTPAGTLTVPASTFDGGTTDNCTSPLAFLVNNQATITFTCANISTPQALTVRATDASGNFNTCAVVADINDVTAPTAVCKATQSVNLSFNNGTATLNAITINNGSNDACGSLSFLINGQSSFVYTCANIGLNTAVLTVTDGSGNIDTCTTAVTVNDIHTPNPSCKTNIVLPLSATVPGMAVLPVSNVNLNSTDNCGVVSYYQSVTLLDTVTYDCSDIGNNVLNVTMADAAGNTATCVTVVQVVDNAAPNPDCYNSPVQVFLNIAGSVSVPAIALDSNSTDNCGIVTRLIGGAASQQFTCANIGANTVTLTVRDAANNTATCTATVMVRDTIEPTPICKNISVNLSPQGTVTVLAGSINNLSVDNCAVSSLLINGQAQDTFTCANVGTNNAILTVTDVSGNNANCTAVVTVQDVTGPNISCTNPQVYLDNQGQATLTAQETATGTDNCSIVTWLINGAPSQNYNCSHVGNFQPALITATDVGGNTAQCNAFITVLDTVSPVANCVNVTVQLDVLGTVSVSPNQLASLSFDNCGIAEMTIGGQPSVSFTCANVGFNNVFVVVTDSSGNTSTCFSVVEVEDNIAPVANCLSPVPVQLGTSGTIVVAASSINNGSTDACGPLTFTYANGQQLDTFSCQNVGNIPVIMVVEDASGNQSFCASILQISDVLPPTAICQNITAYLNTAGVVTVQDNMIDFGSFDNCQVLNIHLNSVGNSAITYNCSDVGVDTAWLIVQDPYNNFDTCMAEVTIADTISPVVTCSNSVSFNLSSTGPFQLVPADLGASISDICGIDTVFLTPDSMTCNTAPQSQVQIIAIDVNGNIGVCTSNVTINIEAANPTTNAPDTLVPLACEETTITLTANPPSVGTYTYAWSGPGFNSTLQDPVVTTNAGVGNIGWYYLTVTPTGGVGCPGIDSVAVGINVVPPPVLVSNAPICEGNNALMVITNAAAYSGASITYDWSFNGTSFGNNNTSFAIATTTQANEGNYEVVVTVDGCVDESAAPFFLNINELPANPEPTADTLCEGEPLTIFANPPTGNFTYQWSGPNNFTSTTQNPVLLDITLQQVGTYVLTITNDSTCTSTDSVQVLVKPIPVQPNISYNQPLCIGDLLEIVDTTTYSFPPDYIWTLPNSTQTITPTPQLILSNAEAGNYRMFVDMGGCVSTEDIVAVSYEPIPAAASNHFTVNFRDSLSNIDVVSNDTVGGFTITIVQDSDNATVVNNNDGTFDYKPNYSFFGLDTFYYAICNDNCPNSCDTAMVTVETITDFECFIPDAISPNGDDINDTWNIRCVHDYPQAELRLFSRWGTLVYEGKLEGFNGQFKSKDLPDGSYFYVLKLNDTTHLAKDRFSGYLIIQR